MSDICSVDSCIKEVKTRGFCRNHYRSFLRYGDANGKIPELKKCKSCGKEFETFRDAKYCGNDCYRESPEHKASRLQTHRKWKLKHRDAHKSNLKVLHAIKQGKLKKEPCKCGDLVVEGHHDDYSKALEVDWLCQECHTLLHVKMRSMGVDALTIQRNNKRRGTWQNEFTVRSHKKDS